jgi:hypothetical protein
MPASTPFLMVGHRCRMRAGIGNVSFAWQRASINEDRQGKCKRIRVRAGADSDFV